MAQRSTDLFEEWLRAYGNAWETRDADGFGALFTEDARYHWTPLDPPKRGREEIRQAFREAVSSQSEIRFSYEILSTGKPCVALWQCSFERVPAGHEVDLDGVMVVRMSESGDCDRFREWWHSSEIE